MIVGIIADGNRRWAKEQNLPAKKGHEKGFSVIRDEVFPACMEDPTCTGLVVYGFSTENWKRSPLEIKNLFQIYSQMCDDWGEKFQKDGVRFQWCGRRTRIPSFLRKKFEKIEEDTKKNKNFTVYICIDYGSRDEITRAVKAGNTKFQKYLEVPDLDLIIRTGGEQRLSNFCLWQAAYAELFFIDEFLPELTKKRVEELFAEFSERNRRKGK